LIIGIPASIVLLASALLAIDSTISIEKQSPWAAIAFAVFFGAIGGFFLCYVVDLLVKDIYMAFDPEYDTPPDKTFENF